MLYTYEDKYCLFRHKHNTEPEITSYGNHSHPFHEILINVKNACDKKNVIYGNDNFTYELQAGDLIITPALQYHYLDKSNAPQYDRYIIGLKTPYKQLNKLLEDKIQNQCSLINISNNYILMNCLKRFDFYHQNREQYAEQEFVNLMHLLIEEFIINLNITSNDTFGNKIQHNPNLLKIIGYINENLETVTVEALSKHFYYSSTYIYKLFIRYLKISPKDYIVEKKLSYAKMLLLNGAKPNDVAIACGYSEYSTFYRAFVKLFKVPPTKIN